MQYHQTGGVNGSTAATFGPGPAIHAASGPSGAASGATPQQVAAQQAAAAAATATAQNETRYHQNLNADMGTINSGIDSGAGDYRQSILDAFDGNGGFKSQQADVDNEGVQNELAKRTGMQGVRDMVNNGIQGGGVVLDNAGAGTSSAGEALARAYGVEGRQEASKVGSQYAQGQNQISTDQGKLNTSEDNFMNVDEPTKKADVINGIVSSANQALTYLSAMFASANLPDQIDLAKQMADIKARATAALGQYDGQITSSRGANAPMSQDALSAKAADLFSKGTAPAKEFNYTSEAPATLNGSGPSASSLPIYISSPGNKNDNGIPT
jgi:hypothetical protein